MTGQTPSSGRGRGRPKKHSLPPRIRGLPTTSTVLVSTIPVSDASSIPLGPHTQEFVMIPNRGYRKQDKSQWIDMLSEIAYVSTYNFRFQLIMVIII